MERADVKADHTVLLWFDEASGMYIAQAPDVPGIVSRRVLGG